MATALFSFCASEQQQQKKSSFNNHKADAEKAWSIYAVSIIWNVAKTKALSPILPKFSSAVWISFSPSSTESEEAKYKTSIVYIIINIYVTCHVHGSYRVKETYFKDFTEPSEFPFLKDLIRIMNCEKPPPWEVTPLFTKTNHCMYVR